MFLWILTPKKQFKKKRVHIEDEAKEDYPEPLSIFAEPENTITESSENDTGKEGQKGYGNELYYAEQSMSRLTYPREISKCVGLDETIRTD